MQVTVRFFGYAQEAAGTTEIVLDLASTSTIQSASIELRRRFPALDLTSMRFAVGTDYVEVQTPLKPGDILSILPPVGGG